MVFARPFSAVAFIHPEVGFFNAKLIARIAVNVFSGTMIFPVIGKLLRQGEISHFP